MTLWCVVEPRREFKTRRIMEALAEGIEHAQVGEPLAGEPFVVWGHLWRAMDLLPRAVAAGTQWWFVDNAWWQPANGGADGYYSLTYRDIQPRHLPCPDMKRNPVAMKSWREPTETGHVLVALPGDDYGLPLGLDMPAWSRSIDRRVRQVTDRRVVMRPRDCKRPLAADLAGAHCLVTYGSKAAVEAVLAGVPVIVDKSAAAAPVGATDLARIENLPTPDRSRWWASLMCQQYTLAEMRDGTAWRYMQQVVASVDFERQQGCMA